jgi:hypothetical protein
MPMGLQRRKPTGRRKLWQRGELGRKSKKEMKRFGVRYARRICGDEPKTLIGWGWSTGPRLVYLGFGSIHGAKGKIVQPNRPSYVTRVPLLLLSPKRNSHGLGLRVGHK